MNWWGTRLWGRIGKRGLAEAPEIRPPIERALRDLNLEIGRGEFIAVTGKSGSGKSTLLHLLGGLDTPNEGNVYFYPSNAGPVEGANERPTGPTPVRPPPSAAAPVTGLRVEKKRRKRCKKQQRQPSPVEGVESVGGVEGGLLLSGLSESKRAALRHSEIGFLYQAFHLLPFLRAWENVALPGVFAGLAPSNRRVEAMKWLKVLNLTEMEAERSPFELSAGQQQRVALARALQAGASVLLADEPTGNLDRATSEEVLDSLVKLHKESGITIVLVTHDPDVANRAPRRIRLEDGRVVEDSAGSSKHEGGHP
jgi:putative ABC transport system ATP-binding protein